MQRVVWKVALVTALASTPALAAPLEAVGSASATAKDRDRARDRAVNEARLAALEQAIEGLDVEIDEAALAQVRERAEAWTSAYRLLEVREVSGQLEVRLEVEIDIPRLRKRVALRSGGRPRGFAFGGLNAKGCGALDEAMLTQPLRAYGVLADTGDATLSIELECEDRGAVDHTHVQAAAVQFQVRVEGGVEIEIEGNTQGFASSLEVATRVAVDRAVAELADSLAVAARGELELRIEQPWPASRITQIERSLRQSVLGVDSVELAGIASDGSALMRIGGSIDATQLGRALQEASFSGFSLVGLRIDGAHALRVRMQ